MTKQHILDQLKNLPRQMTQTEACIFLGITRDKLKWWHSKLLKENPDYNLIVVNVNYKSLSEEQKQKLFAWLDKGGGTVRQAHAELGICFRTYKQYKESWERSK